MNKPQDKPQAQAVALRAAMEKHILEMLQGYTRQTGLLVEGIDVDVTPVSAFGNEWPHPVMEYNRVTLRVVLE